MTKTPVRSGLRIGATFSVIIVFLALTGFTVTGASLLAKVLGQATQSGQQPATFYFVLFMALVELWNGAAAARQSDQWGRGIYGHP